MRKTLFAILLLVGVTSIPAIAQNPDKESSNVAPVATYVPVVGDTLIFDVEVENVQTRQEATIAAIHSDGKVDVNVDIYDGNHDLIVKMSASWAPRKDFLKPLENAQCKITYRNFITSDRSIPCVVVEIDGAEIWAAYQGDTTSFPGLVMLKEGNTIVRRLAGIRLKVH